VVDSLDAGSCPAHRGHRTCARQYARNADDVRGLEDLIDIVTI
jgi:hypothetical protein